MRSSTDLLIRGQAGRASGAGTGKDLLLRLVPAFVRDKCSSKESSSSMSPKPKPQSAEEITDVFDDQATRPPNIHRDRPVDARSCRAVRCRLANTPLVNAWMLKDMFDDDCPAEPKSHTSFDGFSNKMTSVYGYVKRIFLIFRNHGVLHRK